MSASSLMPGETLAVVGEIRLGQVDARQGDLLRLEEPTAGAALYKGRDLLRA